MRSALLASSYGTKKNKSDRMEQVIRVAVAASQAGSYNAPPPALTFDTNQELLWLGNEQVRMCLSLAHYDSSS